MSSWAAVLSGGVPSGTLPLAYYASNAAGGNTVGITLAAPLSNGYIVFYIMEAQTGGGPWGATFNGIAMDILASGGPVSGRSYLLCGYKAGNLAAGTYSVVGTGGISDSAAAVVAFNGVNQTTPTGTVVGDFQFTNTMTLTPASTTSDLVVMCAAPAGNFTTVSSYGGAGQVNRATGNDTANGNHADISTAPGAASTTTVTVNLSGSVNLLSYAFALKP